MTNMTERTDVRSVAILVGTVLAAFAVSRVPLLNVPFEWFETYFHEISHGLAALLTGGEVRRLELRFDGSGTLWHAGSSFRALVAFAGYAGAFCFGCILYLAASASAPQSAGRWGLGLAGAVALSAALWVRDVQSLVVSSVLIAAFLGLWKLGGNRFTQWLLQFVGVYVVVCAFYSPTWLLWSDSGHSDASTLRQATGLPEVVWVAAWLAVGAVVVRWSARAATQVRVTEPGRIRA
mgnify:FL=1